MGTPNIYQVVPRFAIVNTLTGETIDDDYDTQQAAQEQADEWNDEESTYEEN